MTSILKPSPGGAQIIDGKLAAEQLIGQIREDVAASNLKPGLAVILAGDDSASAVYVRSKGRAAAACGFHSEQHDLPATASQADLEALVVRLNNDPRIHGILVQLPLPSGLDASRILQLIDPHKDVDGFHPLNVGKIATAGMASGLAPCTPAGCLYLIDRVADELGLSLAGREAVIVGRSNIVGKPMAQLLLERNCTVTIAHSRTADLAGVVSRADILVAAVGRPMMIMGEWLKRGAIAIDVGINRVEIDGRSRLAGDIDFEAATTRAAAITPVPGGVGPMTIAFLMRNTFLAARRLQSS